MGLKEFFLRKRNKKNENTYKYDSFGDEISFLADKLLIKSRDEVYAMYKERIVNFDANDKPLSKEEAEQILKDLIAAIISNRKLLITYIERSISDGEIYNHYYKKMVNINDLVSETYIKLKYMQSIQERFEYKKKVYNDITGNMYLNSEINLDDFDKLPTSTDIGEEIDKGAEDIDEIVNAL